MVTAIQRRLASRRSGQRLAACMMLATASLFAAAESYADEPAGTITLSREIPGRGAFRAAAPAAPTTVATAREDVVVATTRQVVPVIASLPDSALESVAWQAAQGNGPLLVPTNPALGSAAVLGNTVPRVTGAAIGGAMSGLSGGAASRPLSSITAPLSSTLGAR